MNHRIHRLALAAALAIATAPAAALAFSDCPADHVSDGYDCTEYTGAGKQGGYFRITLPSDWDGDLVIANHGFDLNDKHIRPHESCSNDVSIPCEADVDCGSGNFCNNISYMGLDEILLPMGKAIAAPTYSTSGWATFKSAKDIKDILKFFKKEIPNGKDLQRVIVTGFSGGGAVTVDATLKLKIDGAVPLCAAAAGGLTTWDLAMDVRMVYDFLCDDVPFAKFQSLPDQGEKNSSDSNEDAIGMARAVDACFGVIGIYPHTPEQDTRLAQFYALTNFDGGDSNVAVAMGFATLGLGDFVRDPERLKGARVGLNEGLDYSSQGSDAPLAASLEAGIKRLAAGKGRKKLAKAFNPDYTKGKGKKVEYPILSMAGAADWLVIPEFQRVFTTALDDTSKAYTQTWIDTFGHCVFTEQETAAVFHKYFEWLGPLEGPRGDQPTKADVEAECIALGGVDGVDCNFNDTFAPGGVFERIPARPDWPLGATH